MPRMRRLSRILRGRLWRHGDFLRLWGGQSVSLIGDQVSGLAIPTLAILRLHATPFQIGLLFLFFYVPYPLVGLPAGVIVDRVNRRRLMIACDLGRFLATGWIPLAALLGILALWQVYIAAVVVGALGTLFGVALTAYVPTLLEADDIVEGNSKLESSYATAQTTGPGLGGILVQLFGAPVAVLLDAFSYLASAAGVAGIRAREAPRQAHGPAPGFLRELREGIVTLLRHPVLRWTAGCVATSNCGLMLARTAFLLFAYRVLHLPPGLVGAMLLVLGVAGLIGATAAPAVAARLGTGWTLALAIFAESLGWALLPLALFLPVLPVVIVAMVLPGLFGSVWNVTNVSLRQSLIPARLQGRIHASHLAIAFGAIPIGALAGGWLGTSLSAELGPRYGLALTLAIGGVLGMSSVLWIVLTPVRRLRAA